MAHEKVVIVTGASRGLGAAAADILCQRGAAVVLAGRSAGLLHEVAESLKSRGGRAEAQPGDVSDPAFCHRIVETALSHYGAIHGLINNAGIVEPLGSVETANETAWRYNIEVNLLGPFFMMRNALASLRKSGGRIVNVSSGAAQHTISGAGAYCAAKAALTHLTRVVADEAPEVTAMAVRPGVVDTDMQALIRREGPSSMPPAQANYFLELKRQGRLEPPRVPARVIAWLSLFAPRAFSGRFLNYDDPEIFNPARDWMAE
jgi:NAD(P)-dependent dehydrogenase (short-subunit alcohol dehydrogenase family)